MQYNNTLSRIYDTICFLMEYFNRDNADKNFEEADHASPYFYEILQNITPIPKVLSPLFHMEQDMSTPFSNIFINSPETQLRSISSLDDFIKQIRNSKLSLSRKTIDMIFSAHHLTPVHQLSPASDPANFVESINSLPLSSDFKLQIALLFSNFDYAIEDLITHIKLIYRETDRLHTKHDSEVSSVFSNIRTTGTKPYAEYFGIDSSILKNADISISLLNRSAMHCIKDRHKSLLLLGLEHEAKLTDKYRDDDDSADMFIITCGSEIRMKIIHALLTNIEMNSTQIAKHIGCPATTLIRHLEVLISNNIIYVSKREGIRIFYKLNSKFLRRVKINMDEFFDRIIALEDV